MDALHDLIGKYAQSGRDAGLIIQRIHECNSLHLNKANKDKIQNFYDVLIRRFIAVGDALHESGDGGPELERHSQLDVLTKTLYAISQESPDIAGAMWSRRLGLFYNAMLKRLNDFELTSSDDKSDTFWPSMGSLLILRAIPHFFPCTDLRHVVATPALLLAGQCLTHTPIKSKGDLMKGLFLTCLMMEYTKDAKRIAPEAFAFIAGILQLFAFTPKDHNIKGQIPNIALALRITSLSYLRQEAIDSCHDVQTAQDLDNLQLPIEKSGFDSSLTSLAILVTTIRLTKNAINIYSDQMKDTERELFQRIPESLSCLQVKAFSNVSEVVGSFMNDALVKVCALMTSSKARQPLLRRTRANANQLSIQTLAPRLENPSSFSVSKDHGKDRRQAEKDRVRREYKREHKVISRELRLDASFIENDRRKEKEARDSKAREQRHKNFAWLVQEQATLNQQVAKGGGLLKGGGIGAARDKVASGKIGIKKGGKFR